MQKKIWAFFLKLSTNMWGDEGGSWEYSPFFPELITDDVTWKQVVDFLPMQGFNTVLIDVGDGIQYESHPEISIPGAWSKEKLRKELDYMRSLGLTPIPKLNFSTGHDAWLKEYSRMISTSIYYKVCEDLIKEVAELFDYPDYFHLGMDEEDPGHQHMMSYCVVRQKDLWWHDAYFFFDIVEKLGMRPWIWSDFCWHQPEAFLAKMPKSVLQSNWAYHAIKRNPDGSLVDTAYQTYVILEEHGFDQVPTSSTWTRWFNSLETMKLSKEFISPDRLVGHMTAGWFFTTKEHLYSLYNDAYRFGLAKNEVYPEL